MNAAKFDRLIFHKTKAVEPFFWDLLDEMGLVVYDHIIKGMNQGPTKEWGPIGWSDIAKGNGGTVVCLYFSVFLFNCFKRMSDVNDGWIKLSLFI